MLRALWLLAIASSMSSASWAQYQPPATDPFGPSQANHKAAAPRAGETSNKLSAVEQRPTDDPFGGPAVQTAKRVSVTEPEHVVSNSPAVQKIKQALGEKTKLEFVETPLKEACTYIADLHKFDIQYDVAALRDAAIDPTALPVSLSVHDISLRSALNLIFEQNNLGFIIDNEVLQITTKEKVDSTLLMRTYDVRDLVEVDNLNQLIEIISATPKGRGDLGVIRPFKTNGVCAVYVSKPLPVHEEIEQVLSDLRKLKAQKQ